MSYRRLADTSTPIRSKRNYLFRSIGFELPTLINFGSAADETPKPVYRRSLMSILSESGIHILPFLTSLTIISINLKNLYVGRTLTGKIESADVNIALLQVAAKVIDLLVIASLTNIVVHSIREEMVMGDGVPLGVISGTFMFSSLSYLWSPELWGSIRAKMTLSVKIRVYGIIVLCCFLAAIIGPSTAVLLIPKMQDWPAGGSDVFIRGSPDEIWPSQVEFSPSGVEPFCSFPNATNYAVCPSGGYQSMLPSRTSMFQIHNRFHDRHNVSSFMFGSFAHTISSTLHNMPSFSLIGNWRSFACETSMAGIHGMLTIYLSQLLQDWMLVVASIPYSVSQSSPSEYKYYKSAQAKATSRVPVIRVGCSDAHNVSRASNEIQFPFLPEYGCWSSTRTFQYKNLNQTSSKHLRTTWIPLPEHFGRVSTGLLFEAPWVDERSRVILGCSVDARWADATLSTNIDMDFPRTSEASLKTQAPRTGTRSWPNYSAFGPVNDSSWSPIQLQQSWLDVLTPDIEANYVPGEQPWHAKTLDSLLYDAMAIDDLLYHDISQTAFWNIMESGSLNRTVTLEWVLAIVIADGLSREGSARVFNTTGKPTSWTVLDYNKTTEFAHQLIGGGSPLEEPIDVKFTKKRVSISITGYSYKPSVLTDYLAIGTHIVYMFLALCHIVRLGFHRRISACWDSFTEFLVLVQNSRPATTTLRNTCAGIRELRTYARVAVIRAVQANRNTSTTHVPHLELLFHEDEERPIGLETLSDDPTLLNERFSGTLVHSRPWAPNHADSLITLEGGSRYSEQADLSRRKYGAKGSRRTKVQIDTLYG